MDARLPLALAVLVLTSASATAAQEPAAPARWRAIFAAADSGAMFRLRVMTGAQHEGRLVRFDSTAVELGGAPAVPLAQVNRLWKRGSAWRTGGVVGAVIVAAGAWGLASFRNSMCDGCSHPDSVRGWAVRGAVVGFALGAGVGSLIPIWRRAHPLPRLW